ncbi:hypothetical protein PG984_007802 [Apiospora sp. TS-2023a]
MTRGQSYAHYAVTGIKAGWGLDGPGSVPVRQEIDEWSSKAENEKQVDLFLQALRRLQDVPPAERDSFFQIAGIHGMPYKSWDEPHAKDAQADNHGYCTHANVLFPPWHRPYMLMYEQQLHDIMIKDIIPNFPDGERQSWKQAADSWRLPFWDWGVNAKVPALADKPEVTVTAPPGKKVRIENPLYQFRMPNDRPMGSEAVGKLTIEEDGKEIILDYGACYATSRCPDPDKGQTKPASKDWIEGIVNNQEVQRLMGSHIDVNDKDSGAAGEMVYRLLTYDLTYPQFATVSDSGDQARGVQSDINLEFIHNNIHYWAGGEGGHMSQIPVATFDPIFWLHHCNIDRLFAIWQQLNPDKWFTEADQAWFSQKIVGIDEKEKVFSTTPLRPFHKDKDGAIWTADEVRSHKDLGYTYPELQPWKPEYQTGGQTDREKYIGSLKERINTLYGKCRQEAIEVLDEALRPGNEGGRGGGGLAHAVAVATSTGSPAIAIARAVSEPSDRPATPGPVPKGMKIVAGGTAIESNDFAISVRFSRFALGGHPFNIQVCLAPADASQPRDPSRDYVGSVYNFSSPATNDGKEVCSNCTALEGQNVKSSAYLPVNQLLNKLLKEKSLTSLEKADVSSLLQRLYWRVTKYGKEVPQDQLHRLDLEIVVSSNTATHFKDGSKPSGFADFGVIPSLGVGSQNDSDPPASGTSTGGHSSDPTQIPSDTQYLALDKTIKLKRPVPQGGTIIVESASIDLNPASDSTGISFMHFDDSGSQDRRNEDNYDVLLSISIRRPNIFRLNSKEAHGRWARENDYRLLSSWFKTSSPKFEIREAGGNFEVYIDGQYMQKRAKTIKKQITHVQYWIKDDDQSASALSYSLLVRVP